MKKVGRNDPCPCNSGKRYKHCCLAKDQALGTGSRAQHAPAGSRMNRAVEQYQAGCVAHQLGDLESAVASYRKALALQPDFVEAYCNFGSALREQGRLDEAVAAFRSALARRPDDVFAHYNLGNTLKEQGDLDSAAVSYRKAISLDPAFADARVNLAAVLQAHYNRSVELQRQGRLDAAIAGYRNLIALDPRHLMAHHNLAIALADQGKAPEAIASYREALAIKPDFAEAYHNLLFLGIYETLIEPQEHLALARGWERAVLPAQVRQEAAQRTFRRARLEGRRLKVGYVSGDFRQHAVSYFIERLFGNHDRARVELSGYSTNSQTDAVTGRIRSALEHWVPVADLADAAFRDRVAADGIDVLVDLSWHTAYSRLGVFAARAAPVQVSYLGLAATGLTEMDYLIGDPILTPPETDAHFNESVWRLPRTFVSYDGRPDIAPAEPDPSEAGVLRLGSFTNLNKLKPATLALWSRVLHALPGAGLLLKNKLLGDAENRRRVLEAMAAHGIPAERIELLGGDVTPGWAEHMAYHRRLDISLDPINVMSGTTTACDALWMGVPVVTLLGDRMGSRMVASMLDALGRPEWIAHSEDSYLEKVAALARDAEQRKQLRAGLRSQMVASPLCDAHGLAKSLEAAYAGMYERWQERQTG